jgi:hypothetical protein
MRTGVDVHRPPTKRACAVFGLALALPLALLAEPAFAEPASASASASASAPSSSASTPDARIGAGIFDVGSKLVDEIGGDPVYELSWRSNQVAEEYQRNDISYYNVDFLDGLFFIPENYSDAGFNMVWGSSDLGVEVAQLPERQAVLGPITHRVRVRATNGSSVVTIRHHNPSGGEPSSVTYDLDRPVEEDFSGWSDVSSGSRQRKTLEVRKDNFVGELEYSSTLVGKKLQVLLQRYRIQRLNGQEGGDKANIKFALEEWNDAHELSWLDCPSDAVGCIGDWEEQSSPAASTGWKDIVGDAGIQDGEWHDIDTSYEVPADSKAGFRGRVEFIFDKSNGDPRGSVKDRFLHREASLESTTQAPLSVRRGTSVPVPVEVEGNFASWSSINQSADLTFQAPAGTRFAKQSEIAVEGVRSVNGGDKLTDIGLSADRSQLTAHWSGSFMSTITPGTLVRFLPELEVTAAAATGAIGDVHLAATGYTGTPMYYFDLVQKAPVDVAVSTVADALQHVDQDPVKLDALNGFDVPVVVKAGAATIDGTANTTVEMTAPAGTRFVPTSEISGAVSKDGGTRWIDGRVDDATSVRYSVGNTKLAASWNTDYKLEPGDMHKLVPHLQLVSQNQDVSGDIGYHIKGQSRSGQPFDVSGAVPVFSGDEKVSNALKHIARQPVGLPVAGAKAVPVVVQANGVDIDGLKETTVEMKAPAGTRFKRAAEITGEKSIDGGVRWTDKGKHDAQNTEFSDDDTTFTADWNRDVSLASGALHRFVPELEVIPGGNAAISGDLLYTVKGKTKSNHTFDVSASVPVNAAANAGSGSGSAKNVLMAVLPEPFALNGSTVNKLPLVVQADGAEIDGIASGELQMMAPEGMRFAHTGVIAGEKSVDGGKTWTAAGGLSARSPEFLADDTVLKAVWDGALGLKPGEMHRFLPELEMIPGISGPIVSEGFYSVDGKTESGDAFTVWGSVPVVSK